MPMAMVLVAPCTPSNPHHAPIGVVKFSPLQRQSCALRLKSSNWGLERHWKTRLISSNSSNCRPRIVCLFDGIGSLFGENAKDAARKAFDKALEGKERLFNNWKSVSQKREIDMRGDDEDGFGGGGHNGGGGGGGSGDPGDEDDRLDTFLAFTIFIWMYMKMRGTRWTRIWKFRSYPYTDFDLLRFWGKILLRRFLASRFWLFLEVSFLYAKLYLHKLRARSRRKIASSNSTD